MTVLGEPINTVEKSQFPCPGCGRRERMEVYRAVVRWRCGHTRSLPPIAPTGRQSRRQKQHSH